MYIFIGQDVVINQSEIIGIFDIDNTSTSRATKAFLNNAQKQDQIISVGKDIPKSFLVCKNKKRSVVILSQISPATLRKRAGFIKDISL